MLKGFFQLVHNVAKTLVEYANVLRPLCFHKHKSLPLINVASCGVTISIGRGDLLQKWSCFVIQWLWMHTWCPDINTGWG